MNKYLLCLLYITVLLICTLYSYALIDPNLTLVNQPWWITVRDPLVQFGYYQRANSWYLFVSITLLLFYFQSIFVKRSQEFRPVILASMIAGALVLSYPFLSHDFFNYIFDAKILTYYHMNPYTHKALDFPLDHWIRFMHWTHRSYPYGPTFLPITLVPSWLGMGKFVLHYIFFKLLFSIFYIFGVSILAKSNRKTAIEFATHPFVLIEGLISSHNDLIGIVFAFLALYYLSKSKKTWGWIAMLLSVGIKYMTMPLILIQKDKLRLNVLSLVISSVMLIYITYTRDIQQWYFFIFFGYMTVFPKLISQLWILFLGVLLSYYPYIYLGGWDSDEKVRLKYLIIGGALLINGIVYTVLLLRPRYERKV